MATATKTRICKKNRNPLLPPTAGVAKIAGRDFVIVPLDDFEEWQEDRLLAAVVARRMQSGEQLLPFEEIEARLDRKDKGRK